MKNKIVADTNVSAYEVNIKCSLYTKVVRIIISVVPVRNLAVFCPLLQREYTKKLENAVYKIVTKAAYCSFRSLKSSNRKTDCKG
ncbi:hypothetical protein KBD45_04010 [Candidatus Dojkabacteria bacterium]|nr:hypothetical protein [Candidatus Dojkabacteria bacterium]